MNKITLVALCVAGFLLSFIAGQEFVSHLRTLAYVPKPPSVMTVIEQRICQVRTPDEILQAFAIIGDSEKPAIIERLQYEISASNNRKEIYYKLQFIRFVKGDATRGDALDLLTAIHHETH